MTDHLKRLKVRSVFSPFYRSYNMKSYHYQLVNVFAESHWGGNPLAVFTEADSLSADEMQLIARQMNLSECAFVVKETNESAVKRLRIFTPEYEMPFAGHPTIGTAFVLHNLLNLEDNYVLQTQAGLVELNHQNDVITFSLPIGSVQDAPLNKTEAAEILGLKPSDIASQPSWVNTGADQLLVELSSLEAVKTCKISAALFFHKAHSQTGISQMYIWHAQHNSAQVRLFFGLNGAVAEDPGTGSAAANLGSWCAHHGRAPLNWLIRQGDEIGRPNRLMLKVDNKIHIGGKVIKVGEGKILIP